MDRNRSGEKTREYEMPDAKEKALLRERARRLADQREPQRESGEVLEVVTFRLGEERYGVESRYVDTVFAPREITPVPSTPPFILGIVNLRGRIVSVTNLGFFFDLPQKEFSSSSRVILLTSQNMEMGLFADALEGAGTLPKSRISPPLPTMTGPGSSWLLGLEGEDTVLLDGGALLRESTLRVKDQF